MDNNELDQLLHNKFSQLREPVQAPSMVAEVMRRIDSVDERSAQRRWVLGFAVLLGALVCLPSVEVLHLQFGQLAGWLNTQLMIWPPSTIAIPAPSDTPMLQKLIGRARFSRGK